MKKETDSLGNRMKRYEAEAAKHDGTRDGRPVVIRLDGHKFHKWTRRMRLQRPFDKKYVRILQETALYLCEQIPTCVMGYCQSDEISLCLRNDQSERSEPWFGNRIQKMVSVSASKATGFFNRAVMKRLSGKLGLDTPVLANVDFNNLPSELSERLKEQVDRHVLGGSWKPAEIRLIPIPLAEFDSRVLFLPDLTEVVNYFIWRQGDCMSNSLSSLAQSVFDHRELHGKKAVELEEMLKSKGQGWDDLPRHLKFGTFVHKRQEQREREDILFTRDKFFVDTETPMFAKDKGEVERAYMFSSLF
ncbi:MAG: tRNA(His) guanylyltransferase Thg1 family protein [Clostridia bacterium]|nr:tRNA(His) guanylyltransferase Thg1 family protein [Clostridia bacterium]